MKFLFIAAMALFLTACEATTAQQPTGQQEAAPIRNFLKINDQFCTGGQPRPEHYAKLKADGIKVVINLRPPTEHRSAEEEEEVKKAGLRYFNIPVIYGDPKDEQADEFLKITDDPANRPAFIHCAASIRAGAFWMIRRALRDDFTIEKAEEEAKKAGLVNAPHLVDFAKKYIEKNKKK
ncbi:MAG: protein tyrosine phosphatase family protein [Blastocatellia bacterium]|nr:protein tyrosine phosphatase family protein [Blastocatellia bacterium]